LKTISDAELLNLVNEQRSALDLEFKSESKWGKDSKLGAALSERERTL
jgi:hypothetical protein